MKNTLSYSEQEALRVVQRAVTALATLGEALVAARAACDGVGYGSEVRAGLSDAEEGHARAAGGLEYVVKLIEGTI